jgi:3-oxoadipate enol-lactonase
MRLIKVTNGARLSVDVAGPIDAPTLILGNSLGTDKRLWDPQMEAFARALRVVRFDTRGHGQSDAPDGPYTLDRLGQDVVDIADALGIERFAYCGVSLGGMVGQWLGVNAGARLTKLILSNTSSSMGPPQGWNDRIALVTTQGMGALVEAVLARWYTPGFLNEAPDVIAQTRAMLLGTPTAGYAGCCAAIRDMEIASHLGRITTPTLVIAGAHDPATPLDHAHAITAAIPGAQLITLPTAHLSNRETPEAYTEAVLGFLGRLMTSE